MRLLEGGNVFKGPEKQSLTQRIATGDVEETILYIEKITGLDFTKELDPDDKKPVKWLGTTGRKEDPDGTFELNSSGDLDLSVDLNEVSKEEVIAKLANWCKSQGVPESDIMNQGTKKTDGWVKDAGDQVHFKTPIAGDPKKGYVQTDFMFFPDVDWGVFYYGGGMNSAYKGVYRNILMSSVAKQLGLKIGSNGVISRTSNQVVTKDPDHTAELILGPGHTHANLENVESIYKALANDPDRDAKLNDFREYLAKDGLTEPGAKK